MRCLFTSLFFKWFQLPFANVGIGTRICIFYASGRYEYNFMYYQFLYRVTETY